MSWDYSDTEISELVHHLLFLAEGSPRHSFLVIMDWLSHTGQGLFSSCLGDYSGEILQQNTHKGMLTKPKTNLSDNNSGARASFSASLN